MGKWLTAREVKVRLLLGVGFLILLVASVINGEFVLAASGAVGSIWALESYRGYRQQKSE